MNVSYKGICVELKRKTNTALVSLLFYFERKSIFKKKIYIYKKNLFKLLYVFLLFVCFYFNILSKVFLFLYQYFVCKIYYFVYFILYTPLIW